MNIQKFVSFKKHNNIGGDIINQGINYNKKNDEFIFTIRKFELSDYDKVYHLWKTTPGMGLRQIPDSIEGIEKFVQRNPNTNFVVEAEEQIIGATLSGHDGRRGTLYHMCVNDNYRRRGIGKMLVQKVIEAMKAENITVLSLFCLADNEIGNGFWSRIGWTRRTDLNIYSYYYEDKINKYKQYHTS